MTKACVVWTTNFGEVPLSQLLAGQALANPVISGGTVDGAVIGGTTPAAGTFTAAKASTLDAPAGGSLSITDAIQNGNAQCSTTFSAQTSTTLAAVTGLSVNVTTGGVYNLKAHLMGTAGASGGLKVAMGGTATVSASQVTAKNWNGTTLNAVDSQATWGSTVSGHTAVYTDLEIDGGFTVQTGGTITIQAAQNASNGTATTVVPGSNLEVNRVS